MANQDPGGEHERINHKPGNSSLQVRATWRPPDLADEEEGKPLTTRKAGHGGVRRRKVDLRQKARGYFKIQLGGEVEIREAAINNHRQDGDEGEERGSKRQATGMRLPRGAGTPQATQE